MKNFLHDYSYSTIKMFVNQFAISLFGAMLSMATTAAENDGLAIVLSCLAIVFYLFLIYTLIWEVGAKDRISVDIKKKTKHIHTGVIIALIANIPNFLIAIAYSIGHPFMATEKWAGTLCMISSFLTMLFEGMYLGIITTVEVSGNLLNHYWWTYFVITIPAILVSWAAYYFGFKNKKMTTLFDYRNPDKTKRK